MSQKRYVSTMLVIVMVLGIFASSMGPAAAHGAERWRWVENWRTVHVFYGPGQGWAGPENPYAWHCNYVVYDCPAGWWNWNWCKRTKSNIHTSRLGSCLYLFESERWNGTKTCLPRGNPQQILDGIRTACQNAGWLFAVAGVTVAAAYLLFLCISAFMGAAAFA